MEFPRKAYLTVNSYIQGNEVVVTTTRTADKSTMTNFYRATFEDDETIHFDGDVSPATRQMVVGVALATLRLARFGFDREP